MSCLHSLYKYHKGWKFHCWMIQTQHGNLFLTLYLLLCAFQWIWNLHATLMHVEGNSNGYFWNIIYATYWFPNSKFMDLFHRWSKLIDQMTGAFHNANFICYVEECMVEGVARTIRSLQLARFFIFIFFPLFKSQWSSTSFEIYSKHPSPSYHNRMEQNLYPYSLENKKNKKNFMLSWGLIKTWHGS